MAHLSRFQRSVQVALIALGLLGFSPQRSTASESLHNSPIAWEINSSSGNQIQECVPMSRHPRFSVITTRTFDPGNNYLVDSYEVRIKEKCLLAMEAERARWANSKEGFFELIRP